MMSRILTLIVVFSIDIAISEYPPTSGNTFKHFRHGFLAMLRVRKLTPPLLGARKITKQHVQYFFYNTQNMPNRRPVNPSPNGKSISITWIPCRKSFHDFDADASGELSTSEVQAVLEAGQ